MANNTDNANPNAERLKALQAAMAKIEKDFGKGSIMKLGDESVEDVDTIPTGSLSLDAALGVGGYPKDSTPGCTAEACNFRDHHSELLRAGCEVIGVSIDSAASHLRFIAKQELNFHLVADTDKKWVEAFGVWGEKKMYGRSYMGTFRTTFIIDAEGRIAHVFAPSDIKTKTHAEQVLKWLEAEEKA